MKNKIQFKRNFKSDLIVKLKSGKKWSCVCLFSKIFALLLYQAIETSIDLPLFLSKLTKRYIFISEH